MSAIWGAIDMQGKDIPVSVQKMMRRAFDKCVIDRYEEICFNNVYMGCGIQYFVPEAKKEQLPLREEGVFFTADVVLDNREELCNRLELSKEERYNMPDGRILYEMYRRFGKTCLNELLGAYTFVWYDWEKNQIELVLDAVGNRCLYYRLVGSILYFSSLMEPLANVSEDTALNDRWLVDFLAMDHLFMVNETEETPLQNIFRIAPAQYICIKKGQIEKEQYWKPFENYAEYHLASDKEYKEKFRCLWEQAVKDVMRTEDEISILLSGGLDSTAVAAIAAPYLKEQGKKLYSYTSVPMEGYQADNSGYYITDEREDVEKTAAFYGNIETTFVDLDGKHPWELAGEEFKVLEIPYKSVQNSLWLVDSMHKAYHKGSRLILSGSYGNTSISFTDLNVYMNTLYHQKQFSKLKKELESFSKNMGFSTRYAWKDIYRTGKQKYEDSPYVYAHSYVNRMTARAAKANERILQMDRDVNELSRDFSKYRFNMVNFLALRQIGELVTKHSLATGVLLRDPTKDKRIIEYCIHLPLEQFCREGIDRRLVKVYLKDIMPSHVIRFQKHGKQSADIQYRFSLNWENIRNEWIQSYEKYEGSRYVDTVYAKRQLIEQTDINEYSDFDLTRHMYTLFVLQYESYLAQTYPKCNSVNYQIKVKSETQPLLSVVIPVYNVKEYLERCVESVCGQTYKNLDILLIDDGSTDGSGELCDELAQKDNRIRVIHKENAGVSSARNVGLEYAIGELIAFVDSDDWLDATMYESLYTLMWEHDADVACCNYRRVMGEEIADYSDNRVRVYYGAEMLDTYITGHENCFITPTLWNRLYRREVFEGMQFPPIKKYEDYMVSVQIFARIKKGVLTNRAYYNYSMRTTSLSHESMNEEDITAFIYASQTQNRILEERLCDKSKRKNYFKYYCILLGLYCKAAENNEKAKCKKLLAKELRRMRKEARIAIWDKPDIGLRDKLHMEVATYTPGGYVFLNGLKRRRK